MYSILITFGVLLIVAIFRWMLSGKKENSYIELFKIFISKNVEFCSRCKKNASEKEADQIIQTSKQAKCWQYPSLTWIIFTHDSLNAFTAEDRKIIFSLSSIFLWVTGQFVPCWYLSQSLERTHKWELDITLHILLFRFLFVRDPRMGGECDLGCQPGGEAAGGVHGVLQPRRHVHLRHRRAVR